MRTMIDDLMIDADLPVTSPTTLYDLMMSLQDVAGLDGDDLVVAIVTYLWQSGRLSFAAQGQTYN